MRRLFRYNALRSLVSGFELLADGVLRGTPVPYVEIAPLADLQWPFEIQFDSDDIDPLVALSLFKSLCAAFLDDPEWLVLPVFPGIPLTGHPASGFITAEGGDDRSVRSAQWSFMLLDCDGRRPDVIRLRVCPERVDPGLCRTCVTERAAFWHAVDLPKRVAARRAEALHEAEAALFNANPGPVRRCISSHSRGLHDALFGSAWDVLTAVAEQQRLCVAPGTWSFPESSAREIRLRAVLFHDVMRLFVCPATFCPDLFRMHTLEWLAANDAASLHSRVDAASETVRQGYPLWRRDMARSIASAVSTFKPTLGRHKQKDIEAALISRTTGAPIVRRIANWLCRAGLADWCVRGDAICKASNRSEEVILMRRLLGTRIISSASVEKCAEVVGVRPQTADYLIHRKYRPPVVDTEVLIEELRGAGVVNSCGSATDLAGLGYDLFFGGATPEVFDGISCLFPANPQLARRK